LAKKTLELIYPDKSRKHISCAQRDSYLLTGEIEAINEKQFRYIGQARTYRTFADLGELREHVGPLQAVRRFVGIPAVIFSYRGKRRSEHEETPEGMVLRLKLQAMA